MMTFLDCNGYFVCYDVIVRRLCSTSQKRDSVDIFLHLYSLMKLSSKYISRIRLEQLLYSYIVIITSGVKSKTKPYHYTDMILHKIN